MILRVLMASLVLLVPVTAFPQLLPDGFEVTTAYGDASFQEPVGIVFLPDGRDLVVERGGVIRVVGVDDVVRETPYLDISDEVCGVRDLGLLGVAISPEFTSDPWVYLLYTVDPDGDGEDAWTHHFSRLTRYCPSGADPDVLDPETREVLIGANWSSGIPSPHESHTIGALCFGDDGSLLLGSGDGAHHRVVDSGGLHGQSFGPDRTDPAEDMGAFRARSVDSMSGKILRVDPATGLGLPSNPFFDGDGASDRSRVWAYGLRNPYRFVVRPGTGSSLVGDGDPGTLYVGDVGWRDYEELNVIREGGLNLGWPCFEGAGPSLGYPTVGHVQTGNANVLCDAPASDENPSPVSPPTYWWEHGSGATSNPVGWTGFSSTGGTFYDATAFPPRYHGQYFVADFVSGWLRLVEIEDDAVSGWSQFGEDMGGIVGVHVDPVSGDLLYVDWFTSQVKRISYTGPLAVDEPDAVPASVSGFRPLANPFRDRTTLAFTLDAAAPVTVSVYDMAGRRVRGLSDRPRARGEHHVVWDGRDDRGRPAALGVYVVRLAIGDRTEVVRVVRQG